MKMKKLVCFFLAGLMALSGVGCGKSGGEDQENPSGGNAAEENEDTDEIVEITIGNWPNKESNAAQYETAEKQKESFEDMYKTLRENKKIKTTLIYVDAEESVLIKRYSETRRLHPLSKRKLSLDEAIVLEGSILEDIASLADLRIDTSSLSIHDLAAQITTLINGHPEKKLVIVFESFGFKNGIAKDADFIFDARFLPNPFWDPSLRSKTGLDIEVVKFFDKYPQVNLYINQIDEMLTGWLGDIEKSNRSYLTVAIGCTGGCHRSVFIAQSLYERFEKRGLLTKVRHRSLEALKAGDKKS